MTDSEWSGEPGGREYGRVVLTIACAGVLVTAAALLPLLAGGGLGGSPLASQIPVPSGGDNIGGSGTGGTGTGSQSTGTQGSTSSGQLGALNPSTQTGVGGSLAEQNATNPFRTLGNETHFVVTAPAPAYWRTGAYAQYTGDGWQQVAAPTAYSPPIEQPRLAGRAFTYRLSLRQPARAVPTAWRPRSVSFQTQSPTLTVRSGALSANRRLQPGTRISGRSVLPERQPAVLRRTGGQYPDFISDRYTQLPTQTDERLRPFVQNLTADANAPYERAVRIEAWLERTKSYSLNVSAPPTDDVATQFVFELDRGYCEYFATAMVAMLRASDVPARYVVGYSSGEQTGSNEYTVRGMHAHAWVEVYFPDAGWVRFDPTPGTARLAAEANASDGTYTAAGGGRTDEPVATPSTPTADGEVSATPGDAGTATATATRSSTSSADEPATTQTPTAAPTPTPTPTPTDESPTPTPTPRPDNATDTPAPTPQPQLNVSLNRSAVPGAAVTVSVRRAGDPVVDAQVLFNEDPIGRTNATGQVGGTVPYTRTLNITVRRDGERLASDSVPPPPATRSHALAVPTVREENTTTRVPVNGTLSVTISGQPVTAATVTVIATIEDIPVANATVSRGTTAVGTTDQDGRAAVALPAEPGTTTITVARGAFSGNTTLQLPSLRVQATPVWPLAIPFTPVRVTTSLGNDTATNVTVRSGGATARTGPDGAATLQLPAASAATITAEQYGQTVTTTVPNLYRNAALLVIGVLAISGGVVIGARRRGLTPRSLAHHLRTALAWLARQASALIVAIGMTLGAAWVWLVTTARQVRTALRAFLARRRSAPELLAALVRWLRGVVIDVRTWGRHAIAAHRGDDVATAGVESEDTTTVTDQQRSLRELWQRFIGYTSVRRPRRKTPGEIATHAIETDGLPVEPVTTLRDAVRAVEFGAMRAEAYLPRATDALAAIETAVEADSTLKPAESTTSAGEPRAGDGDAAAATASNTHSSSDPTEPAADSDAGTKQSGETDPEGGSS